MKLDTMLVSVIVPIYKVEEYLDVCVQSILDQTYTNIEVILVDDGSPDRCPAMCDEWGKKDNRIRVLHKSNGGLSDARNAGMCIASGEYYVFVDSDDYIHPEMIAHLYEAAIKENLKMVCCNFESVTENKLRFYQIMSSGVNVSALPDALTAACLHENRRCYLVAWNRIYHRSLFESIQYPKGKLHEDVFIAFQLLEKAGNVGYIDEKLYFYRQREGSITQSKFNLKSEQDDIESYLIRIDFLHNHGFDDLAIKLIQTCIKRQFRTYIKTKNSSAKYSKSNAYATYWKYRNILTFIDKLKIFAFFLGVHQ